MVLFSSSSSFYSRARDSISHLVGPSVLGSITLCSFFYFRAGLTGTVTNRVALLILFRYFFPLFRCAVSTLYEVVFVRP